MDVRTENGLARFILECHHKSVHHYIRGLGHVWLVRRVRPEEPEYLTVRGFEATNVCFMFLGIASKIAGYHLERIECFALCVDDWISQRHFSDKIELRKILLADSLIDMKELSNDFLLSCEPVMHKGLLSSRAHSRINLKHPHHQVSAFGRELLQILWNET